MKEHMQLCRIRVLPYTHYTTFAVCMFSFLYSFVVGELCAVVYLSGKLTDPVNFVNHLLFQNNKKEYTILH